MGMRMNFTEKQVGRMTLKKFNRIYENYKYIFDLEMTMKIKEITYEKLETPITIDDVIPL